MDGWNTFSFPFGAKRLFSGAFALSFQGRKREEISKDHPNILFHLEGDLLMTSDRTSHNSGSNGSFDSWI